MLSLVDRTTGRAKSMMVDDLKAKTLVPILKENIAKEATVYTDEAGQYTHLDQYFEDHDYVRHGMGEYVRGEVHTNTIEGYFSIFKRGMKVPIDRVRYETRISSVSAFRSGISIPESGGPDVHTRAKIPPLRRARANRPTSKLLRRTLLVEGI